MPNSSHHVAPAAKQLVPAWSASILFHFCLMVLLALEVQQRPRGVANERTHSAGIILMSTSAEVDLYEDNEQQVNDQVEAAAAVKVPEIVSALSSETAETDLEKGLPKLLTARLAVLSGDGEEDTALFPSDGQQSGSPGASGRGARVSVFGVEGTGTKFVYLFDRSASMEGPPLTAAKRQLMQSLESLESVHQFHIIFFNTKTRSLNVSAGGRRVAFANDRNKQLAARFVRNITADGGTDRLVALREAISFSPDVIFFLTDADDPMPASELADIERWNRRANAVICVIEFGRKATPPGNNFLKEIARQTGGQYGYVNAAALPK